MVTLQRSGSSLLDTKMPATLLFIEKESASPTIEKIAQRYFPALTTYLKEIDFSCGAKDIVAIPCAQGNTIHTLIIAGLGSSKDKYFTIENYRRALGRAIKCLQAKHIDKAVVALPEAKLFGVSDEYLARETAIIANMAAYRFDEYITDEHRRVNQNLSLDLIGESHDARALEKGLASGMIIAQSVNHARHWVDLPPVALPPMALADKANTIAKEHGLKITIFSEQEIIKMGMGGLAAVSAGSEQDCKLVIMEYKTQKKDAPTIAFVGKGITFDSGGLSLKPAASMETMKEDMSGAAAVIAAMKALAQLKPDVNIIALTTLSENLPSGKATKPGDIIRFYNGKTAEVRNTDAEGRLVLADALSYAVKNYKPDAMIDLATLTGACAYALGPFFSGMMSQHEDFAGKVKKASEISGDSVWALPFTNDYKTAIISDVADICNIGSSKYKAGAVTAGFFLQNFVGETPWVHLDIAGTAFDVPDISYYSKGATGVGVRLLVDLALNWQ